ncbi:MAG: ThiF family adenylyltransferase [Anaerolineae bacterium]|nr:ThiF family adenylyltransferase [Anaerolineae bacterium]
MSILTLPTPLLRRLVLVPSEAQPTRAWLRTALSLHADTSEWLARGLVLMPPATAAPREPIFGVTFVTEPPTQAVAHTTEAARPPTAVGHLYLGVEQMRGRLWGVTWPNEQVEPLASLKVAGPGLHTIPLAPLSSKETSDPDGLSLDRWSRTIGALGSAAVWQRLVNLHIALVGCGRTGSLIAVALARLGLRHLTLIDPDRLELHNLGEMDAVVEGDLGRPKVDALAPYLIAAAPAGHLTVQAVARPITDPDAVRAAKRADVLIACVDNDTARLAMGIIATLYHKPLLDIGTGVLRQPGSGVGTPSIVSQPSGLPPRTMGADLRLILPGQGCILCVGGLGQYGPAVNELMHRRPTPPPAQEWHQQRAGSLRSLNTLASGLALQMLNDLVAERLTASTWARLEVDAIGHLTTAYPVLEPPTAPTCPLCGRAGLGDNGLGWG